MAQSEINTVADLIAILSTLNPNAEIRIQAHNAPNDDITHETIHVCADFQHCEDCVPGVSGHVFLSSIEHSLLALSHDETEAWNEVLELAALQN